MRHYRNFHKPVTVTSPCDRCGVEITAHGRPPSECLSCVEAAQAVWPGARPIAGGVSGG